MFHCVWTVDTIAHGAPQVAPVLLSGLVAVSLTLAAPAPVLAEEATVLEQAYAKVGVWQH